MAAEVFATSAEDDSIRLWDFRSSSTQACLPHKCAQLAFDPLGIVLAAASATSSTLASNTNSKDILQNTNGSKSHHMSFREDSSTSLHRDLSGAIDLFDSRMLDAGPFSSWLHPLSEQGGRTSSLRQLTSASQLAKEDLGWRNRNPWASVQFSPNGETLLVSTCSSMLITLDAFSGVRTQCWSNRRNFEGRALEASFSPDGLSIVTGSTNGNVHIYDVKCGDQVVVMGIGLGDADVEFISPDWNDDRADRHSQPRAQHGTYDQSSFNDLGGRQGAREELVVKVVRFHPRSTHPMIAACAGRKLHLFAELEDDTGCL